LKTLKQFSFNILANLAPNIIGNFSSAIATPIVINFCLIIKILTCHEKYFKFFLEVSKPIIKSFRHFAGDFDWEKTAEFRGQSSELSQVFFPFDVCRNDFFIFMPIDFLTSTATG